MYLLYFIFECVLFLKCVKQNIGVGFDRFIYGGKISIELVRLSKGLRWFRGIVQCKQNILILADEVPSFLQIYKELGSHLLL